MFEEENTEVESLGGYDSDEGSALGYTDDDRVRKNVVSSRDNPRTAMWGMILSTLLGAKKYLTGVTVWAADMVERLVGVAEDTARSVNEGLRAMDSFEDKEVLKKWYAHYLNAEVASILSKAGQVRSKINGYRLAWVDDVVRVVTELYTDVLGNISKEMNPVDVTLYNLRKESVTHNRDYSEATPGSEGRDDSWVTMGARESDEWAAFRERRKEAGKRWVVAEFPLNQGIVRQYFPETINREGVVTWSPKSKDIKDLILGNSFKEGALSEPTWFTNVTKAELILVSYVDAKTKAVVSKQWRIRGAIKHSTVRQALAAKYGHAGLVACEVYKHEKHAKLKWKLDHERKLQWAKKFGLERIMNMLVARKPTDSKLARDRAWTVYLTGDLVNKVADVVAGKAALPKLMGEGFHATFWEWIKTQSISTFKEKEEAARPWDDPDYEEKKEAREASKKAVVTNVLSDAEYMEMMAGLAKE